MASLRPTLKQQSAALIRPGLSTLLAPVDKVIAQRTPVSRCSNYWTGPEIAEFFGDRLDSTIAARALTVKVLNLCLARYHFQTRTTAVSSRPYGMVVDPINNCNLACPGCVHSSRAKELQVFS